MLLACLTRAALGNSRGAAAKPGPATPAGPCLEELWAGESEGRGRRAGAAQRALLRSRPQLAGVGSLSTGSLTVSFTIVHGWRDGGVRMQ